MKFVADKAIPHISEAFSTIGTVELLPACEITPATLTNADGLLVRTTTRITQQLLEGSRIKFVGTATIGTDHIDMSYLKKHSIHQTSAPGCNATAVGEYVLTALLALQQKTGISLHQRTMGIIGAGNTGTAVRKKAEAIGINCLFNDPPLAEISEKGTYMGLDELIRHADIISVHVPLIRSGKHPTNHIVNRQLLQKLRPGTILINTSRGETLDGVALKNNRNHLDGVILDVWENEPDIDPELIPYIDIATPHIAGYSIEGKIRATEMVFHEACDFFKLPKNWNCEDALSGYEVPKLDVSDRNSVMEEAVTQVYDIRDDDTRLRQFSQQDKPGEYFADLRNNYQFRREFSSFRINVAPHLSLKNRQLLSQIGFRISDG